MAKYGVALAIIPTVTTNIGTKNGNVQNIVVGGPSGFNDRWTPNIINDPANNLSRLDVSGDGNEGAYIQFDYGQPVSVGRLRYFATTPAPFGVWQLMGSQNGTTWDTIGFPVTPRYGTGLPTHSNSQYRNDDLPFRVLDMSPPAYTLDTDTFPFWFINTLFYRYFRLVGVDQGYNPDWPPYPVDGNGQTGEYGVPPFEITCWDLVAREYAQPAFAWEPMGQALVWAGPFQPSYLGPGDGTGGSVPAPGDDGGTQPPVTPTDPVPPPPPPPYSDYFHPYSRGYRGDVYNATTNPGGYGNGVTIKFEDLTPPISIGGGAGGDDNSFGAAAGNGPYLGEVKVGARFVITVPTPSILTGLICVTGDNGTLGTWKLQAEVNGAWVDISNPKPLTLDSNKRNNRWGTGWEILADLPLQQATRFSLVATSNGSGGRIANEILCKFATSKLAGGDRRYMHSDDWVRVTSNIPMVYRGLTTEPADNTTPERALLYQELVGGVQSTGNGGGNGEEINTAPESEWLSCGSGTGRVNSYFNFLNADNPVGSYFSFQFKRGVTLKAIQWVMRNRGEELSGGVPTLFGRWKCQWSNSANGPWTDCVSGPFTLQDRAIHGFVQVQGDGNPHGHWRVTKVSGNQTTGGGEGIENFNFVLEDVGEPTTFPTIFQDEDGIELSPITISEPTETDPWKPTFRDEDGLVITKGLTIKPNIKLPAVTITDESVFDVFTELSERPLPIYNFYQKGRV